MLMRDLAKSKCLLFCTLIVFFFTIFSSSAIAQSCSNEDTLLACAFVAVENCRTDASCEDDRGQAITKQDIIEDIADTCCNRPKQKQVRTCLKKQGRKVRNSLRRATPTVKDFLREVNAGVRDLRQDDCSTGTLGEL